MAQAQLQEEQIYQQLKKCMDEYNADFEGACRRSEEIVEDERKRAEQASKDWKALEGFGLIL